MSRHGWYILSATQLRAYFTRISFPEKYMHIVSVSDLNDAEKLNFLAALHKYSAVKIPFENLNQHYSWHRCVNIKQDHVFRKIISQPGRGGYCMETNVLLHSVILSLGFDSYLAGSRVYMPDQETWSGMTHLVPIVTIGGTECMVDIAYGPRQPIQPHPLQDGRVVTQIAPSESRVIRQCIPQHRSTKKVWLYQNRISKDTDWTTIYCVTDLELLVNDIEVLNSSLWHEPTSLFKKQVVVARYSTEAESLHDPLTPPGDKIDDYDIDGTITINHDIFTWRRRGKVALEVKFRNDEERVQYLWRYFGIRLDQEDAEAIVNTISAVQPAKES